MSGKRRGLLWQICGLWCKSAVNQSSLDTFSGWALQLKGSRRPINSSCSWSPGWAEQEGRGLIDTSTCQWARGLDPPTSQLRVREWRLDPFEPVKTSEPCGVALVFWQLRGGSCFDWHAYHPISMFAWAGDGGDWLQERRGPWLTLVSLNKENQIPRVAAHPHLIRF